MKKESKLTPMAIALAFMMVMTGFATTSAFAQIAGHNVILVHGFHSDDLILNPSDEEVYARQSVGEFWRANAEGALNWSGEHRVEGHIAEQIFEQAKVYSEQGLCDGGCVLVTHSTGDLVSRYFMANQEIWMENAGLEPLNIIATIDLAGAGGGTDLADIAVGAANSEYVPLWMKLAAGAVLGLDLDFTDYDELGVVLDLTYSGARNLAMEPMDIPRLRFSVCGDSSIFPLVDSLKLMIQGADDTVLPASSTCGASSPAAIESCSNHVDYEGKRRSVNGPDGLLYNHFPVLMSENYDHFTITDDEHQGKATYAYNNFDAGLNVDFATYTKKVTRKWWQFWIETGTWQYVTDSKVKSLTRLVYDTLNN